MRIRNRWNPETRASDARGHGGERGGIGPGAERHGLAHDRIILSAKVSGVQDLIDVYRTLAAACDYPLHLGLTEAGMGSKGIVASTPRWRRCCRRASETPSAYR